jgi:tetratricopeptide (TPR) repeat protein
VLILLIAIEVWRGDTLHAIWLAIGLVVWVAARIWAGLPGIYYAKLNKAGDWHRWEEVLELVEKLEKIRRHHRIKLPAVELSRSRAKALAGLGRLPEALAELDQCENQPGMPGWLHKAHVAVLYDVVRQHDKALEFTMLAIAEKPTPVLYADLANRLLRFKRDTVRARVALAEVEKGALLDKGKAYIMRSRGILAYLEGDYASAREELEAGLAIVEARHQFFKDGYLNIAKGGANQLLNGGVES